MIPDQNYFTICGAPMLGSLAAGTIIHEETQCSSCNMPPKQDVEYLEYDFDFWSGEAAVTVLGQLLVSQDLKEALERSAMQDFTFGEAYVEYSQFAEPAEDDPDLVDFWHLKVVQTLPAGDGWWINDGICQTCGATIWKMTDQTTQAIFRAHEDESLPRRSVIDPQRFDLDIFNLSDLGPVVVSGKMLDFLRSHGATGLEVQPVDIIQT